MKKIVVIGGGTGAVAVLSVLNQFSDYQLNLVVLSKSAIVE